LKRNRKITFGALCLLVIMLCVPAFSGALAAEEQPIDIPIGQETDVFAEDGTQIGVLRPDPASGIVLQLTSGESFSGVRVLYDYAAANKAGQSDALAGKTVVQFAQQNATPEGTLSASGVSLPTEGWIHSDLVITALSAQHALDASRIATKQNGITSQPAVETVSQQDQEQIVPAQDSSEPLGVFSQAKSAEWLPFAAIALTIIGLVGLGWIAFSASVAAGAVKQQNKQLSELSGRLLTAVSEKTPTRVEQSELPRSGRITIDSDALDRIVEIADQGMLAYTQAIKVAQTPEEVVDVPKPVPEGEEPDLLALANQLAGKASAAEWYDLVKESGWRAMLLQSNPAERGTYIADNSGYSIVACLMRSAEAEVAYVLPSYQDPNASEDRWREFYVVNEDMVVKNYRLDALATMHIERGTFFLQKSKGKLTRRPQSY